MLTLEYFRQIRLGQKSCVLCGSVVYVHIKRINEQPVQSIQLPTLWYIHVADQNNLSLSEVVGPGNPDLGSVYLVRK